MNRFFQPAITAVLLSAALVVIAVTLLSGSVAQGASYKKTDGTIVGPIMDNGGSPHSYSGNNLEPFAWLHNADLTFANLTNANLSDAWLHNADLAFANLTGAFLFNAFLFNADLTNANLFNADLFNAYLANADLGNANLTNANLSDAYLNRADLTDANLTGAYLANTNLFNANLTNANLFNANLTNADLGNAYMYGTNLLSATFSLGTTLYDGQTVLQHGFDTAGLQAYLEASPVNASSASNLTIVVPEPHTLLLASLASMGLMLRRRRLTR